MDDDYMTGREVSEKIRVPLETLRYWRYLDRGPRSFKLGRRVLYARADVERWIADARANSTAGGAA